MIYFVPLGEDGPIKIGVTTDMYTRMQALQVGLPYDLKVLKVIDVFYGRYSIEKWLHRKFAHLRLRGEWFRPGEALLKYLADFDKITDEELLSLVAARDAARASYEPIDNAQRERMIIIAQHWPRVARLTGVPA